MIRTATFMFLAAAIAVPATAQDRKTDDSTTANDPAIVQLDKFLAGDGKPAKNDNWKQRLKMPPKAEFSKDHEYFWNVKTNKGEIKIRMLPEVAPMHVSSTIYLVRAGFYDDLIFHRVIKGFMAQGGCPMGRGMGGPGYNYDGEYDPKVKHDRPGLLSMANTGRPRSDGSQFFLTFVPTPHLNGKHTIFGEVVGGMDVVKALEKCGSRSGKTSEKLEMQKTWISVVKKKEEGEGDNEGDSDKGKGHDKEKGKGEHKGKDQ